MQKVKVPIDNIEPGMMVADDIYSYNNQLIISKNTLLSDRIITRLRFYSINDVAILVEDADVTKYSAYTQSVSNQDQKTYSEKVKASTEFKKFNNCFVESVEDFKGTLNNVITKGEVDVNAMLSETDRILSQARNGVHLFDMLHNLRTFDDITYAHSLNVALICNIMGNWLHMNTEDINILMVSGLLHDLGKLMIPQEIITKPGKLTPEEFQTVKRHPLLGYNILKNQNLDTRIKYVALMHHERCDGTGYPTGFHRDQIDDFAKIVAIADVYDAMTSPRCYRAPLCPFEIIALFESDGLQKYDPHFILTFLEGIVQCYVNNEVRLSNGMKGEIVMINKTNLSKPIININGTFLDLSKHTDISITAII